MGRTQTKAKALRRRWVVGPLSLALALLGLAGQSLSAAEWDAGGGERWQALLAKAKQEGPVVVAGCAPQAAALSAAYKRDTGLEATFLVGQGPDLESRFHLEAKTRRLTIDFRFGGPPELELAKAALLVNLNELLVLPEVTDLSRWSEARLVFVDNEKRNLLIATQYVSSLPIVNAAAVDVSRLETLQDLLRPEFKGKIAFYDPTAPGPGQTAAAYLASVKGVDFVKALFGSQNIVLSRDTRQLTEWAARGLYPITFGGDNGDIETFRRQGINQLALRPFRDAPGTLTGGCTVISIPKGAPHAAAATVFLNWYLSRNGQETYVRASQQPSRRVDVSRDGVLPELIPAANGNYLDQYREDWYLSVRPGLQAELRKALDK